jgi:DNA-binding NarL/FixJ family response regulator
MDRNGSMLPHPIEEQSQGNTLPGPAEPALAAKQQEHRMRVPKVVAMRTMTVQPPISVVVADDHALVRQGIAGLLRSYPGITVLAECCDGSAALKAIAEFVPDIAVIDIAMPGLTGLEVLTILGTSQTKVVVLTATATDKQLVTAIARGARGVLHKDVALDELVDCIRAVAQGKKWVSTTVAEVISNSEYMPTAAPQVEKLSIREQEVMRLASKGLANKQIARKLGLSDGTVKIHLHNIYQKLGVPNRTALTALVVDRDAAA